MVKRFIMSFKYEGASDLDYSAGLRIYKSFGEIVPSDDETDEEIDSISRMKPTELDQNQVITT